MDFPFPFKLKFYIFQDQTLYLFCSNKFVNKNHKNIYSQIVIKYRTDYSTLKFVINLKMSIKDVCLKVECKILCLFLLKIILKKVYVTHAPNYV